jgi:MOSC domain-containing protein YiiM
MGKILSVQVGLPRTVTTTGQPVETAIYKEPISKRVAVGRLGLAGDGQADLKHHGGENQAVYAFAAEHYPHWRAMGYKDLAWGQFGENITTDGLDESQVRFGDRYRVGSTLLEAYGPRIPCSKLGLRMGSPRALKDFIKLARPGIYYRVLEEGDIQTGDTFSLLQQAKDSPSIHEVAACRHDPEKKDRERLLAFSGLPQEWRDLFNS